ncbi:SHOCT domain-containing protein [Ornithinimicrobium sp. W1679]|uniref:SHOCT domain-containing protein n=1 Tax=Ornithinimicrobium sp. W1679 TaxID=3418770 RepID=UPI003CFB58BC
MIWFWTALLVVGLALLAYTLVRVLADGAADRPAGHGSPGGQDRGDVTRAGLPATSRARAILDERYATGELTTEEYEHRRAVLARGEDGW